jgi:hypothetical protein
MRKTVFFLVALVFPNPAESSIHFRFFLPQAASLELKLYDLQGKMLRQQSMGRFSPGKQQLSLELNDLSPGIYGYTLKAGEWTSRGRLVKK